MVSLSNRINPTASVHTGPVSPGLMGTPKRAMDILFALAALIFLAPLLAALAIMVKLSGPGTRPVSPPPVRGTGTALHPP